MRRTLFLLLIIVLPALAFSQEKEKEEQWGIKFHGFVKTDIIWDSRQSVAAREGHFHLYPKAEMLDTDGEDINARPYFNMLSIQTRLKGVISGPDVWGAKTNAVIEGAFFGHTEADVNGFRLRHAFAKLDWGKTQLLVGQYWHPMFVTECFPGTVSFNTGTPFQPFSRNPQIRLSHQFGDFSTSITALSQRDFADAGVNMSDQGDLSSVASGSVYARNAGIPEMNLSLNYKTKFGSTGFIIGVAGNYKKLAPRIESIVTDADDKVIGTYKSEESVQGLSGLAFMKLTFPKLTVKAEAVMGQCTYGWTMLGGYVAEKLSDPTKGFYDFEALDVFSMWTDIHTNGKVWQVGLFSGFTQNWGAANDIETSYFFARGYSVASKSYINYIYRVAPRLMYNVGKMRFAAEVEYNNVNYGKALDTKGMVQEDKDVTSIRAIFAVYYFF
jgi:hypothetical protein